MIIRMLSNLLRFSFSWNRKKRKASATESEEGTEKMKQMKKKLWQSKKQITNKELPTIPDISSFSLLKSNLDDVNFFEGFEYNVVSKKDGKDGKAIFAVKFSSTESALTALKEFKGV
ncbi:unnamed protein product [Thlaspi arvense]|uniref:RRM domain-containing protein n=1 Tax=Thlaspi arvense TaxID=13288 RepID=A0AAU9RW58_THLAR|nr:unnamed protein product [Thlaspi arvense]